MKMEELSGKHNFYVTAPKDDVIPAILKKNTGTSKAKMSDGLFCLFGHDKADVRKIHRTTEQLYT